MKPVILLRKSSSYNYFHREYNKEESEPEVAEKYFPVYNIRGEIPPESLVIPRYSALPYFSELEQDLKLKNCKMLNSFLEYSYIADITAYYEDLKDYTPKTYSEWGNLAEGKWIVKGKTNSRKFNWDTHMYAEGRENLLQVIKNNLDDPFISEQGIVVREYVPLKQVGTSFRGLPISREWRCFFYKENLLCSGFYWSSHSDLFDEPLSQEGIAFVKDVAKIVSKKTNGFVIDVGEKKEGGFIVIELNSMEMAGLSNCDPEELYSSLFNLINKE
ncbi:MAG: ATP-grasp domain-containing protein [Candidatus Pacearchaeota archaeon]